MWQRDKQSAQVENSSPSYNSLFEMLIKRYHVPLSAYAYRLIGAYDPAQDIVQETWIALYDYLQQKSPSWLQQANIAAWLWTVTKNKTINYNKAQQRIVSLDTEKTAFIFEPHVSPFDYPENAAIRDSVCLLLHQEVNALKKQQRDVIVLRFFCDYSLKDIAQALHIPLNTVKSDIRRGRQHLLKVLSVLGVGNSDIDFWDKTHESFPKINLPE